MGSTAWDAADAHAHACACARELCYACIVHPDTHRDFCIYITHDIVTPYYSADMDRASVAVA